MFISYPMGGQDEGQGHSRYQVLKILSGELQIGNLRDSSGYPLFIAPFAAVGKLFGRFDERVVLLAQLALSSLIPFLLYDILRTRHSQRAAFVAALLSLVEPFSLQWAHFSLPVWLVALCLVFALWLLHHAERQRSWQLVAAAGLVTGIGVLGRWNYAPVAAGIGCLLLFVTQEPLRRRLCNFALFGASAVLLALLVFVVVQLPATGVWNISCIAGHSMLEKIIDDKFELLAAHGPHSERLLRLVNLPPLIEDRTPSGTYIWFSSIFPLWQVPGSWAGETKRNAFTQQESDEDKVSTRSYFVLVSWLYYYLGPCETDRLMLNAFYETIRAQFGAWLLIVLEEIWQYLQAPLTTGPHPDFTLPPTDTIIYQRAGGILGFERAVDEQTRGFYNGHWVWRPGIELFTSLWAPLNALRFLVIPALVWAFFTRWRVYSALAFLLLLYVIVMSVVDFPPEARIYAIVYPLGPVLVGGLLVAVWERLRPILGR